MNFIDGFSEAEYNGRRYFQQRLDASSAVTDYNFTESKFDKVDCYWSTPSSWNVGEIKYRQGYKSTDKCMVEGGAVLEKHKYDHLKYLQNVSGCTPYYITMFNDSVGYIFDLSDMENVEWVEEKNKYPKTTMGDKSKITKAVTYLPLSSGKKFGFNINVT